MTVVVAGFSATMLVLALGQRQSRMTAFPARDSSDAVTDGRVVFQADALSPGSALELRVIARDPEAEGLILAIRSRTALPYPGAYVYWQEGDDVGTVSPMAVGLGQVAGSRWLRHPLPPQAARRNGVLVVYSVGHDTVVDGGPLRLEGLAEGEATP